MAAVANSTVNISGNRGGSLLPYSAALVLNFAVGAGPVGASVDYSQA